MKTTIGFIGCGNMGGALASCVAKAVGGDALLLCDADSTRANALAASLGARVGTAKELVAEANLLFLGVKPQGFPTLFEELRPVLAASQKRIVLISMAAGISIADIETMAGTPVPVIRIMPNTPVQVGSGMVVWSANSLVSNDELRVFKQALSEAGRLDPIDETKIDAAGSLSGCGPAFVYLFAEALADGAVECGLSREKADLYAAQTLLGAAEMLLQTKRHPGALKDAVCSPGGTTIAGIHALENGKFRATSMSAVTEAYRKTLELKK